MYVKKEGYFYSSYGTIILNFSKNTLVLMIYN